MNTVWNMGGGCYYSVSTNTSQTALLTRLLDMTSAHHSLLSVKACVGVWRDTPSPSHYLPFTLTLCCKRASTPGENTAALLLKKKKKKGPRKNYFKEKRELWSSWAVSPVSGLISSSSFTMPSPCMDVQRLMGEPPPILLYCSWIFGVRRLAMNGPSLLQSQAQIKELQPHHSLLKVTVD